MIPKYVENVLVILLLFYCILLHYKLKRVITWKVAKRQFYFNLFWTKANITKMKLKLLNSTALVEAERKILSKICDKNIENKYIS